MRFSVACGVALLSFILTVTPSTAQSVTVDKVTVKQLKGSLYTVNFSGTISKLTNIGGGYQQWVSIASTISQTGTMPIAAATVSLTPPTFTATGSYSMTASCVLNVMNANWTASSEITWSVNANPVNNGMAMGTKGFTCRDAVEKSGLEAL